MEHTAPMQRTCCAKVCGCVSVSSVEVRYFYRRTYFLHLLSLRHGTCVSVGASLTPLFSRNGLFERVDFAGLCGTLRLCVFFQPHKHCCSVCELLGEVYLFMGGERGSRLKDSRSVRSHPQPVAAARHSLCSSPAKVALSRYGLCIFRRSTGR
jgi:hypothetical protein